MVLSLYVCCQVDYVDASRNQVVLKMIPRIDYSRKRGVLRNMEDDKKGKRKAKRRPPAKLFDPDSVRCVRVVCVCFSLCVREVKEGEGRRGRFEWVYVACIETGCHVPLIFVFTISVEDVMHGRVLLFFCFP